MLNTTEAVKKEKLGNILGPKIILVRDLVKFVPYHTCLKLLETFMQPCTSLISMPGSSFAWKYWSYAWFELGFCWRSASTSLMSSQLKVSLNWGHISCQIWMDAPLVSSLCMVSLTYRCYSSHTCMAVYHSRGAWQIIYCRSRIFDIKPANHWFSNDIPVYQLKTDVEVNFQYYTILQTM